MFTKFLSLLAIAARGLKINSYVARGTEKVAQHCNTGYETNYFDISLVKMFGSET